MSQDLPYFSRIGKGELFISAPNDAEHIIAFQEVIPDATYDNILEEWRVPWDGNDIAPYLDKISKIANQRNVTRTHDGKISTLGVTYGYAQVSEDEGAEVQIDALRQHGIPDDNIFLDKLGPRNSTRPKLDDCLNKIQAGDVLVVRDFNRIGRSLKQFVLALREIKEKGAYIKSLDEEIDTSDPYFSKFIEFVGYAGDFEQKAVGIRTKAGLKAAVQKAGRVGGRKRLITKDKVEMMATLFLNGMNISEVAKLVGVSRAAIYRNIPGGPKAILDAYQTGGQPAVDKFVNTISEKLASTKYDSLQEKVVYLHKIKKETIQNISNITGLNIKTVRQYIQDSEQ